MDGEGVLTATADDVMCCYAIYLSLQVKQQKGSKGVLQAASIVSNKWSMEGADL
jgi:hypothetical protein